MGKQKRPPEGDLLSLLLRLGLLGLELLWLCSLAAVRRALGCLAVRLVTFSFGPGIGLIEFHLFATVTLTVGRYVEELRKLADAMRARGVRPSCLPFSSPLGPR